MVTGVFSWLSWAIAKAISIGISIISFGFGKFTKWMKGEGQGRADLKGVHSGGPLKEISKFFLTKTKVLDGISGITKNIIF